MTVYAYVFYRKKITHKAVYVACCGLGCKASLVIQFLVGNNIFIKAYAEEDNTADVQLFARNAILLDGGDWRYTI